MKASQIVEAVLFASDAPLKADEIARADESLDEDRVEEALQELRTSYDEADRAFRIAELGEGYQILTRPEFATYLERFDTVPKSPRLSGPALETLAIIAYRQPIGRVEVEYIRGVSSSGVLRTLQDRALIEVVGRDEGIGRPYLYGTTEEFLDHFGFASLEDLPRTEELPVVLRENPPLEEEDPEPTGDAGAGPPAGEPRKGADLEEREEEPDVEAAVERVLEGMPAEPDGDRGEPPPDEGDETGEPGDRTAHDDPEMHDDPEASDAAGAPEGQEADRRG